MPRQSLNDLLRTVEVEPTTAYVSPATPAITAATDEHPVTSGERTESSARAVRAGTVKPNLPAYLKLVRKETRLREDQQNLLTLHARRLNRLKAEGGARITDNTLIRIAIDLLLAGIENASGDDEASLLESLNR